MWVLGFILVIMHQTLNTDCKRLFGFKTFKYYQNFYQLELVGLQLELVGLQLELVLVLENLVSQLA